MLARYSRPTMRTAVAALLGLALAQASLSGAVQFDLPASATAGNQRCVSQYLPREVLVQGEVTLGAGEDQSISIEVVDESPSASVYHSKRDLPEHSRFSFSTHVEANYRFCFTNTIPEGKAVQPGMFRTVTLLLESGAETADMADVANRDKLATLEVDMLRLEKSLDTIVRAMEDMRVREEAMRDTNESTYERVRFLSFLSMGVLLFLAVWQVWYMRRFLRTKKLI